MLLLSVEFSQVEWFSGFFFLKNKKYVGKKR